MRENGEGMGVFAGQIVCDTGGCGDDLCGCYNAPHRFEYEGESNARDGDCGTGGDP